MGDRNIWSGRAPLTSALRRTARNFKRCIDTCGRTKASASTARMNTAEFGRLLLAGNVPEAAAG